MMIQETIIGDLHKRGIELVSVAEPDLSNNDPTRKLLRQMMGAISEYEKTMIVLKLRAARQRTKAKTGRCEGQKPFGAKRGEQATIARMKELRSQGLSLLKIAEQLHGEGRKPRAADRWQAATIARILRRA
jgi:DNA invertase Pin-like site-specific DNA recombinase